MKKITRVLLDLTIQKSGDEYYCQGKLSGTAILECWRCLEAYPAELTEKADFIICSADRLTSRDKDVIDDEDYVYFRGDDRRVDLSVIVNQAFLLSLPMKPLCSEGCRGLCPRCGVNLNTGQCDCRKKEPDARWQGLKDLFNQ
ncbi:MAG: DUF177 domain-containing protein [candidate division Zixibacteria bacterium]|nr:DUF177 domain-containing protein [candidate division Zixibacteria bacterium]